MNAKEKILIVEDEEVSATRLLNQLRDHYDVDLVTTGEDAWRQVNARLPDLILLDEELPGINGLDVCKKIRADSRFSETKIIMISGHSDLERRLAAYRAGVDDFLGKPVSRNELLERVATDLAMRRSRRINLETHEEKTSGSSGRRQNCWEFMQCGRDKTANCPAFTQGLGRLCWLVAGTMCGGKVSGAVAQKMTSCMECRFYQKIKAGQQTV